MRIQRGGEGLKPPTPRTPWKEEERSREKMKLKRGRRKKERGGRRRKKEISSQSTNSWSATIHLSSTLELYTYSKGRFFLSVTHQVVVHTGSSYYIIIVVYICTIIILHAIPSSPEFPECRFLYICSRSDSSNFNYIYRNINQHMKCQTNALSRHTLRYQFHSQFGRHSTICCQRSSKAANGLVIVLTWRPLKFQD